jgi:hypothetical protein
LAKGPKAALANLRRRKSEQKSAMTRDLAALGVPFLVGVGESRNFSLPTIGKVDPDVLYGLGGVVLSMGLGRGMAANVIRGGSIGLLACGAKHLGKERSLTVGGIDDYVGGELEDFE